MQLHNLSRLAQLSIFMHVICLHATRICKVVQYLKKVKYTVHNTRIFTYKACINRHLGTESLSEKFVIL